MEAEMFDAAGLAFRLVGQQRQIDGAVAQVDGAAALGAVDDLHVEHGDVKLGESAGIDADDCDMPEFGHVIFPCGLPVRPRNFEGDRFHGQGYRGREKLG